MSRTVDPRGLRLSVPETHYAFLSPQGELYSPSVSGSVLIAASSRIDSPSDPKINVSLIRTVMFDNRGSTARSGSKSWLQRIGKRASVRDQPSVTLQANECTSIETVAQCNLCHPPDRLEQGSGTAFLGFDFSLPIPDDTPGTTDTVLGSVSYSIRATAISGVEVALYSTQPIRILRCLNFGQFEPTDYFRYYPSTKMITELRLTPKESLDATTQLAYHARLVARRTVTQGVRKTEKKYVVVEKLKWRVEETVNVMAVPCSGNPQEDKTTCKEQYMRQLCGGKLKGHWVASGGLQEAENKPDWFEIDLDISIPRAAKATGGLDLPSYNFGCHRTSCKSSGCPGQTAITVDHQLKLDIITGEDTFDQVTGKLVDRKPSWNTLSAFFPILVHEVDSGKNIPESTFDIPGPLPRYEDLALMPPRYESAV